MNSTTTINKSCWKCKNTIDQTWAFCPSCAARLHDTRVSSSPQGERDVNFLKDLYSFGWYNHDLAAIVLYEGVVDVERYYHQERPEDFRPLVEAVRSQQILRAKIFAEFIALLEVFGNLCITIRERKTKSMIWTYLNTEPNDVAQFYDQVLSYPKPPTLTRLLKLPTRSQIRRVAEFNKEISLPEVERLDDLYGPFVKNIEILAQLYRDKASVNVQIYNKIKHVFPIIEGDNWIELSLDDRAVILIDDTGKVSPLSMSQKDANIEMVNIRRVTVMGSELLALSLGLHKLGILL